MEYFQKEIECMSFADKEALQSKRLVDIVKVVYDNVKYYRAKMDAINLKPSDIKGIQDIHKLPYTVKQDLRDNYPFDSMAVDKRKLVRLHASSATTGKLTVAGHTAKDIDIWAECAARSLVLSGATPDSCVHVAYGYGLFTGGLGMHYGAEKLGAIAVPVSSGNTKRQLELLRDFQSDIICCTPSYAIYLAEELERSGYNASDINLKAGLFGAEAWTEEMRAEVEKKFNLKAYDVYGLSEMCGPGVANDCYYRDGMHFQDDHFYPEIIDPESLEQLDYGKQGELVITTLTKEGMPLIRYRTRDITTLTHGVCRCGRTSVKMNKVVGRTDDMLIIRGVNVFPSQIESILVGFEGVEAHYHIYVDRVNNLDTIEIHVELSEKSFSDEVQKIEQLRAKLSSEMAAGISITAKIVLVSPKTIARSEGKAKRVTDLRNK